MTQDVVLWHSHVCAHIVIPKHTGINTHMDFGTCMHTHTEREKERRVYYISEYSVTNYIMI